MFESSLIMSSGAQVDWPLPLMVAWLVIALTLSVIDVLRDTEGVKSNGYRRARTIDERSSPQLRQFHGQVSVDRD